MSKDCDHTGRAEFAEESNHVRTLALVTRLGFILIVIGNQWREQQNPHIVEGAEWVDKEKQLAQSLHFYPTFIYWIGQNVHSDFSATSN